MRATGMPHTARFRPLSTVDHIEPAAACSWRTFLLPLLLRLPCQRQIVIAYLGFLGFSSCPMMIGTPCVMYAIVLRALTSSEMQIEWHVEKRSPKAAL